MLCCPNEAAREDQGGVQYGGISGHKTEPRVEGGGSNLSDSTAPPIRSSSYSISQLSEESNPEAAFLVSLLQKGLKNFTLEKGDGLW